MKGVEKTEKIILDACCGSKMFWFDKQNPFTIYADNRIEKHVLCDNRVLEIKPDIQMDFTNMPFPDSSFKLVIFDPPHMTSLGTNSWMALKYGRLTGTWQDDIKKGFNECMRVLETYSVLVFKWNEHDVKRSDILKIIDYKPLVTQNTGKHNKTIWMVFMKLPV
jgi:ubiquinone/menaquinone biosynthesis C-methylase UbiE